MATQTRDADDSERDGPGVERYERYRYMQTPGGDALIYDAESKDAWIQSRGSLSLDEWR